MAHHVLPVHNHLWLQMDFVYHQNTILNEILDTFINSALILFRYGLYPKWAAEPAKATK